MSSSTSKEKENVNNININLKNQNDDHLHQSRSNSTMDVPPMSELDSEVLENLPPEILAEMNEFYGGKLKSFLSKLKSENIEVGSSSILPSSLSQIDASVLQELPKEIQNDIIDLLPPHRNLEPEPSLPDPQPGQLWVGDPPNWIQKFSSSNLQILRLFSDTYSQLKSNHDLSSLLLKCISSSQILCNDFNDDYDDVISCLHELLKQYIDLKIDSDLEEIHTCFRLLKRLSGKSEIFLQVYNITLPRLQMIVSEKYGGSLHI